MIDTTKNTIRISLNKNTDQIGKAYFHDDTFDVYVGKSGCCPEKDKREGDHKTPLGRYQLKHVFYRQDKIDNLKTTLPQTIITPNMGWCDDPDHPDYNRLITKPFQSSHEDMYRDDHLYDLVVEISHNDSPPIPKLGSAVFLHLKRAKGIPTAGCVAFDKQDILKILSLANDKTYIEITLIS